MSRADLATILSKIDQLTSSVNHIHKRLDELADIKSAVLRLLSLKNIPDHQYHQLVPLNQTSIYAYTPGQNVNSSMINLSQNCDDYAEEVVVESVAEDVSQDTPQTDDGLEYNVSFSRLRCYCEEHRKKTGLKGLCSRERTLLYNMHTIFGPEPCQKYFNLPCKSRTAPFLTKFRTDNNITLKMRHEQVCKVRSIENFEQLIFEFVYGGAEGAAAVEARTAYLRSPSPHRADTQYDELSDAESPLPVEFGDSVVRRINNTCSTNTDSLSSGRRDCRSSQLLKLPEELLQIPSNVDLNSIPLIERRRLHDIRLLKSSVRKEKRKLKKPIRWQILKYKAVLQHMCSVTFIDDFLAAYFNPNNFDIKKAQSRRFHRNISNLEGTVRHRRKNFTQEEVQLIIDLAPTKSLNELAELLGTHRTSVFSKYRSLVREGKIPSIQSAST